MSPDPVSARFRQLVLKARIEDARRVHAESAAVDVGTASLGDLLYDRGMLRAVLGALLDAIEEARP